MTGRGQTIHDYLLGVVLVLLTIAGVFAFFPEVFTPFEEPVESDEQHMSQRLADEVVQVNQTMRDSQTVNYTGLTATLTDGDRLADLVNSSGIPGWKQVNVTIVNQTGIVAVAETSERGSVYRLDRENPAATTTRTIIAQTAEPACNQSCQVVVRVWGG
jgi:hypothetical protein